MPNQATSNGTTASSYNKKSNRTLFLVVAALFLIVIISVFVYLLLNNKASGNDTNETNTIVTPSNSAVAPSSTASSSGDLITIPERVKTNAVTGIQNNNGLRLLVLQGQVTGFFEGTVNYRLLNSNGIEIYSGTFQVGDNYEQFADFNKSISLPEIPAGKLTATGKLQIYDVSMKDGSETILQEVSVTF